MSPIAEPIQMRSAVIRRAGRRRLLPSHPAFGYHERINLAATSPSGSLSKSGIGDRAPARDLVAPCRAGTEVLQSMTMGHDDFYDAMKLLRELVSGHPLQPFLMDDITSWTTLCDAMDSLQDNQGDSVREIRSQQDAMNTIRDVLGIEVLDWEDLSGPRAHQAAIQASIEAVNTELGDRANAHYEQFDDRPLSHLPDTAEYALTQIAAIATKQQRGQSTEWVIGLASVRW